MRYVVICHCYSGTGRLLETSSKGEESIEEITLEEGQDLCSELIKLLAELNNDAKHCFWVIHQVITNPI